MTRLGLLLAFVLCSLAAVCHSHEFIHPLSLIKMDSMLPSLPSKPFTLEFSVTPIYLEAATGQVTVVWAGLDDPKSDDWIALYSPLPSNLSSVVPVKYKMATLAPTHLSSGSGALNFTLLNMREPNAFVFFRGGLTSPVAAAVTPEIEFGNYNEPLQGHLSLTGDPSEMSLMWVSKNTSQPIARIGTQPGQYTVTLTASTHTYNTSDMCGAPATTDGYRPAGLIHTVVFAGLAPRTRYYYVFGDDAFGLSNEHSFVSAPARGDTSTIRVVTYGDMGRAEDDGSSEHQAFEAPSLNTTARIVAEIDSGNVDLVGHWGDISYARGYASDWDSFFHQIFPIASRVPYLVSAGNHERDFPNSGSYYAGTDSGGECGIAYDARFLMPYKTGNQTEAGRFKEHPFAAHRAAHKTVSSSGENVVVNDTPWYSVNFGPIHITAMSTEHDFHTGSPQYKWIEQDLAGVNRLETPWLIFTGHRPMYIDSTNYSPVTGDQPVAEELRKFIEPLLYKYKVDVGFWGHHHSYQRSCPVVNLTCVTTPQPPTAATPWSYLAPVEVVIGMAGQGLSQNIDAKLPSWAVLVNDQVYGYSRFTANATTFHFEFIVNNDGSVGDTFTLTHSK